MEDNIGSDVHDRGRFETPASVEPAQMNSVAEEVLHAG
jgi:hypothetical protein